MLVVFLVVVCLPDVGLGNWLVVEGASRPSGMRIWLGDVWNALGIVELRQERDRVGCCERRATAKVDRPHGPSELCGDHSG